jgi:glutamate synthase (NADPH/NADH) small chain
MLPRPDSREISGTDRLQAPPVAPPVLSPEVRIRNFDEVHLPWTPEMAMAEASRCLHCLDEPCVEACPLHNDIPLALWLTEHGDFEGAAAVFRETSNFSEICSRVCSQSHQCESACPHLKAGKASVAVGRIEGFLADHHINEKGWGRERPPCSNSRVAVVGAGPAGLTAAELLAQLGHSVTVFDQWPSGGGVLRYGTPRFKLDHTLVQRRLDLLRELGVEFIFDTRIGGENGLDDLFSRGFQAVFLGTGSTQPMGYDLPGAHLRGVHTASSFLVRANVEQNLRPSEWEDPPEIGEAVVVIGAGETALNCTRTALRLGPSTVTCVYGRSREEVFGNPVDETLAREEGASFKWLLSPVEVLGDDEGKVRGLRCQRVHFGRQEGSGRRTPEVIRGSEFELPADTVVFAVGSASDPSLARDSCGLEADERGALVVDPSTGRTTRPMVWAGGENVTGPSPVARAVYQARLAVEDIHQKISWR